MLKPLGHRLLIQPDAQPDQTDSGLILPQDRDHVPVSGTVIAVGDGPARDQRIRLAVIARCQAIVDELAEMGVHGADVLAELQRYRNDLERFEAPIHVGDRVAYPVEAGLQVHENGIAYVLLNDDDVAVIALETEEAA